MVDLLRKSSFLLFNKLHFCTMTPTESTPIGVLFSLAPPPVPERSTLRAEGAEGGRISLEILPTRAAWLEVCRMVRVLSKKGLFLQSVCDDTRGLLPPLARSPSLPEGGLKLSRRYLLFERPCGLSFPSRTPEGEHLLVP